MSKTNVRECSAEVVSRARAHYETYTANSDNLNFRGDPCPTWDALPEAIQSHWCAVELAGYGFVQQAATVAEESLEEIDYAELDAGIRKLVKLLRDNGFNTTDSGDGISKFADTEDEFDSCAEPIANVYIETAKNTLLVEADRLTDLLRRSCKAGLFEETVRDQLMEQDVPKVVLEATFLPLSDTALLAVHGITDQDLVATGEE